MGSLAVVSIPKHSSAQMVSRRCLKGIFEAPATARQSFLTAAGRGAGSDGAAVARCMCSVRMPRRADAADPNMMAGFQGSDCPSHFAGWQFSTLSKRLRGRTVTTSPAVRFLTEASPSSRAGNVAAQLLIKDERGSFVRAGAWPEHRTPALAHGEARSIMAWSDAARRFTQFVETRPGFIVIGIVPVATATTAFATSDWWKAAEICGLGLGLAVLVSAPTLQALRRSFVGRAMASAVYRASESPAPRGRTATRAIMAARGEFESQSCVRDDIDRLRRSLAHLTERRDIRAELGDGVHMGPAALMREVKSGGNRQVEAVFTLRGRDNSSWKDGWKEAELHVVADGNTVRPAARSLILLLDGGQRSIKIKGRGHTLWQEPNLAWNPPGGDYGPVGVGEGADDAHVGDAVQEQPDKKGP